MPTQREARDSQPTRREKAISALRRAVEWADRKLPRGLRTVAGLLLAVAGLFGFLPLLGFWMLPLGIALIALDIPPLRRRLFNWLDRHQVHPPR